MSQNKSCILPWISLETMPTGQVRPCCLYSGFLKNDEGVTFNLGKDGLLEIWNSNSLQSLRERMQNGQQPTECSNCWDEESAGKKSKRLNELERFAHLGSTDQITPKLQYLDLKLGNICNLKCRTCSSDNSSKWASDENSLGYQKSLTTEHITNGRWAKDSPGFWNDLETILPNIEKLEFAGGEPFLSNEHFQLLKICIDRGFAPNIDIHYNTNGTLFPENADELWPHFKSVSVMLSIDGTQTAFEYMRHPAKWTSLLDVVEKCRSRDYIYLTYNYTLSALNAFATLDFVKWAHGMDVPFHMNFVHQPDHYCIKMLPEPIKQEICDHLAECKPYIADIEWPGLLGFFENTSMHPEHFRQFLTHIKTVDKLRNESFDRVFPEYNKMLSNCTSS